MHARGGMTGGHDIETDVAQLALETTRAQRQDAADPRFMACDVRAVARDDDTTRSADTGQPIPESRVT
jgi:hypothetical protein